MPAPIDLTGRQFGLLTVIRLSKGRGPRGQRLWLCRCSCGKKVVVRAGSLVSSNTESCGCSRAAANLRRIENLTGKRFGHWIVLGRSDERTAGGRVSWRVRCCKKRRGKECGHESVVAGSSLTSSNSTACRRHRKSNLARLSKGHKIPRRVKDGGEWWVLPMQAARMLHVKYRCNAPRDGIRQRMLPTGIGGALVNYWSEDEVKVKADARSKLETAPEVADHLSLEASAKELGRSKNHVRTVVHHILREELVKVDAKDRKGRPCSKTYVPTALQRKLQAYLAAVPQRRIDRLQGKTVGPFVAPEPVHATAANGTNGAPAASATLNQTQKKILALVKEEPLQGKQIATRLRLDYDYARRVLGGLVKAGLLVNDNRGYALTQM